MQNLNSSAVATGTAASSATRSGGAPSAVAVAPPVAANPARVEFLDIGRGVAVIGVIAVHAAIFFRTTSPAINLVFSCAQFGVQLFFLISAYTMCLTYEARVDVERSPVLKFWLRRYFRLALPFWVAICLYQIFRLAGSTDFAALTSAPVDLITSALLIDGFWPASFAASVPGGGSITTEVCFYLLFPLLFRFRRSIVMLAVLVIAESLFEHFLLKTLYLGFLQRHDLATPVQLKAYFHYYIGAQFPIFVFGIVIYNGMKRNFRLSVVEYIACAMALLVYYWTQTYLSLVTLFFSVSLVLLCQFAHRIPPIFTSVLAWIGKRSYSVYLFHFAVINLFVSCIYRPKAAGSLLTLLAVLIAVVAVTAVIAEISRRWLENTGVSMGKYIIKRM